MVKAIKTDDSSVEEMLSIGPGIRGSFHAAVKTYAKKRRADFTKGGVFDGSGHHMLGLVENFESRQKDVPLASLGFAECQEIYDFWRNRPLNTRTRLPLSAKHSYLAILANDKQPLNQKVQEHLYKSVKSYRLNQISLQMTNQL